MKLSVGAIVLAVSMIAASEDIPLETNTAEYHNKYGIPKAIQIKQFEDKLLETRPIGRTVGGYITDVAFVPYQVGLIINLLSKSTSICGGSVISETRILTAAHCDHDTTNTAVFFTAVLGSNTIYSGGLRIFTNDILVHSDWDPRANANDIAILRIPSITFTDVIQPVALPSEDEQYENFVGEVALASGFGITSDDMKEVPFTQRISSVNVEIISNSYCARFYSSPFLDTYLCARGEDGQSICSGDSGGPLVVEYDGEIIQVGITSFGKYSCELGVPDVYTRVTAFLSWIKKDLNQCMH